LHLHRKGFTVKIIEASDRVGGRIKTDVVDGFRWIRVSRFYPSYPEAKQLLDDALQLKTFAQERQFYTMVVSSKLDPFRRPSAY
jgi:phytoene dehydrogenase-like protein